MKFWNFKYNGVWKEVISGEIKKPEVIEKLISKGFDVKYKDVTMSINAPFECPTSLPEKDEIYV